MNPDIQIQERSGDPPPKTSRQCVILLCDQEGLDVCLQRQLVGTTEPTAQSIRPGYLVFLYHAEERHLYGVWAATSEVGTFDASPWGLRNPIQLRVNRASHALVRIPRRQLVAVLRDAAIHPQILTGHQAREIERLIQTAATRKQRNSKDLVLVKWAAWAVVAAAILLVILVIWGLSTHDPNQFSLDGD